MNDLEHRLRGAAGPDASFPTDAVRGRVRRRRRVRAGVTGAAGLAVVLAVGLAVLPRRPAVDLEVGAGPDASVVAIDLVDAPTRLPEGYRRCGEVTHDDAVTVQTFCSTAGERLVLRFGPHDRLPELGPVVDQLRGRPVHDTVRDGTRLVTISDVQSADDRHYRVEAPSTLPTSTLVDVVDSVPAFVAATD